MTFAGKILISLLAYFTCVYTTLSIGGNLEDGLAAYERGDFEQAYQLWLAEAEKGDATAQTYLGMMYANGQGVLQSDREAARWYEKAAELGDARARNNLGVLYATGRGVPQNDEEAARWFLLAAKQGDAKAQFSIGIMYDVGRGVLQNHVVAYAWYLLAQRNGLQAVQTNMEIIEKKMTGHEIELAAIIAEQLESEIQNSDK